MAQEALGLLECKGLVCLMEGTDAMLKAANVTLVGWQKIGSGLVTAMILIVAMPVAAGATVWTGKGQGDQPTMVGLVVASTLVSPFTFPATVATLTPLLRGGYAAALGNAGHTMNSDFALTGVMLPCAAGIMVRLLLPERGLDRALRVVVPVALVGSLALTYTNAVGAVGSFVARPRPLLLVAASAVAALVCALSFTLGRIAARVLRLDMPAASSLTLASGMNNSSASAVLITTALPDKPHLLLPVLMYGLLQKTVANRVVRTGARSEDPYRHSILPRTSGTPSTTAPGADGSNTSATGSR